MCRPLWHDFALGSDAAAPNERWAFLVQQRARLNRIRLVDQCLVGGAFFT
jgi:hypothetical protein